MNRQLPTECHLYWVAYESGGGYFTLHTTKSMENYKGYSWLAGVPVDFGEVVFDEKELTLKSLNSALGEVQGKVNFIKERIQELLAIGHDSPRPAPVNDFDKFDDDIPF